LPSFFYSKICGILSEKRLSQLLKRKKRDLKSIKSRLAGSPLEGIAGQVSHLV